MKLIYCITGSFCNHKNSMDALRSLSQGNEITPVISEIAAMQDTRFGRASELVKQVTEICGRKYISNICEAEATVTPMKADALIISPCTGNTLAKIANGITDTVVTMCAKCQLRNRLPVIIALATNDGLSANLFNIAMTLEKKNVYFVPFGQDNAIGKPSSLICDFGRINETLISALDKKQLQPILI